jgi:hypothetical protein
MGWGADGTIIMGQVVKWMMVEGDCRVGNKKNEKYGKGQRKSLMYGFTCHMVNYKCLINFVNSLICYLLRFRHNWNYHNGGWLWDAGLPMECIADSQQFWK